MLNIKSVMVTGASGKLGGPLCEALLAEGYRVIAADRRLPVGVDGVEEVQLDVADGPAVEAQVARSDAVIHLASCKEDREALIKVSMQGTFNLLDAAMRTKRPQAGDPGQRRRGQRHLLQPPARAHPRRHADGRLSGLLCRSRKSSKRRCSSSISTRRACPRCACGCRGFTPRTTSSRT